MELSIITEGFSQVLLGFERIIRTNSLFPPIEFIFRWLLASWMAFILVFVLLINSPQASRGPCEREYRSLDSLCIVTFILTDRSSLTGFSSILNLSTLELKLLVILRRLSLVSSLECLGLQVPGPVLVGKISNSVCLKEELLKGAECSFNYLCTSLYSPGPGMSLLLSKTLFLCDFPKTNAIDCRLRLTNYYISASSHSRKMIDHKSKDNHILQIQKQLRAATAATFFFPLKSHALVLRRQSIFWRAGILPATICLAMVAFLQLSQYWVWALESISTMWKLLLQLPVIRVFPSAEEEMENLSKIASFSNISHSLLFTPSWMTMFCSGFLALQTSHTFNVRQSLVAMYFPLLMNSPPEQDEIMSVMKFFCCAPVSFLKFTALLSERTETRMSHIFSVPLLVPQRKRLSDVGCSLEKVMFSLTSSIFSLPNRSTATKGRSASSSPHKYA